MREDTANLLSEATRARIATLEDDMRTIRDDVTNLRITSAEVRASMRTAIWLLGVLIPLLGAVGSWALTHAFPPAAPPAVEGKR